MAGEFPTPVDGGCGCGALRYRLMRTPLFIHCCNCRQCQRETGTAFVMNAMVEADQVHLQPSTNSKFSGTSEPKLVLMPSDSGLGHLIARCQHCYVAVWSFYSAAGPHVKFIRAGTLDKSSVDGNSVEDRLQPDIFIYTKFKQPWVLYPERAHGDGLVVEEFYNPGEKWPKDVQERYQNIKPLVEEWKSGGSKWVEIFPNLEDCQ